MHVQWPKKLDLYIELLCKRKDFVAEGQTRLSHFIEDISKTYFLEHVECSTKLFFPNCITGL